MRIRRAREDETEILSDIAFKSKGYWGYSHDYMEPAKKNLTVSAQEIRCENVFVLSDDKQIVGFYELKAKEQPNTFELVWLFVAPSVIGQGCGKRLWEHAVQTAKDLAAKRMIIKSDPFAEGFYVKQGAVRIGERPSTVQADLMLPFLEFSI